MQKHEAVKALLQLTECIWVAEYTHGSSVVVGIDYGGMRMQLLQPLQLSLQAAIVVHGELVQPLQATSRRVVILGLVSPVIGEIGGVAS